MIHIHDSHKIISNTHLVSKSLHVMLPQIMLEGPQNFFLFFNEKIVQPFKLWFSPWCFLCFSTPVVLPHVLKISSQSFPSVLHLINKEFDVPLQPYFNSLRLGSIYNLHHQMSIWLTTVINCPHLTRSMEKIMV